MNPAITVLMPVFNGDRYLVKSIRSVLNQTFRDFELLVVDDGSTDRSADVAESTSDQRVRVVRNSKNEGLVTTLNRGLREARGAWVARQDSDDVSEPGRLAEQIAFVRANPSVPLLGADARLIGGDGGYRGRWRTGGQADLVRWDSCFRTPFAHSAAFFRRSIIVERFGGYRDLRASEDFDLWSRVGREFPVVTLRRALVRYRLHAGSIMAAENVAGAVAEPIADILRANLAAAAPGLAENDQAQILGVWTRARRGDWAGYFAAVGELKAGFLRGRRAPPGLERLVAEQHYSLLGRLSGRGDRVEFLDALRRSSFGQWARLPWLRVVVALARA